MNAYEVTAEKGLDPELWHACAGGMAQMPAVNSKVFYFPQGHAERASTRVNFGALPRVPPNILCRVAAVRYLADSETDEVYAKITLISDVKEHKIDDDGGVLDSQVAKEKPTSFAKTLTQSDANNGGGFSVPRYCAETIFPRLDYTADPPVQNLVAKDVHGESWKFRHIYRGTPRRHLLTTGWSNFVNQKKLVAGDSIVFLRAENGDLCVGIRRAKKGFGIGGNDGHFDGFSENNKLLMNPNAVDNGNLREKGRVRAESVVEAAFLAANGQPFEVVYYPRASAPEFCVKASSVSAAMRIQWFSGMRFKMAFETEDSSRISWFTGTISSVRVADPVNWPNSPWRMLQVTWDEPELLNVKCVSPWLVETVSNIRILNFSPFSPPRKKLCVLHPSDFPLERQFTVPSFSGNPLGPNSPLSCLPDKITAGIQGARHVQIGVPLSDLHLINKLQTGNNEIPVSTFRSNLDDDENISCLSSIGNSKKMEKKEGAKTPHFVLFGQLILTEQQMINDRSFDEVSKVTDFASGRKDLPKWFPSVWKSGYNAMDTGQCKVFLDSKDTGQSLDLSILGSYEGLHRRLEYMFGIEKLNMLRHVFYHDATGQVRQTGDVPFSEFMKTARRLTILTEPTGDKAERISITGLPTAERGLDSSKQAGPFTIFA